jgi:hypothetical protein
MDVAVSVALLVVALAGFGSVGSVGSHRRR